MVYFECDICHETLKKKQVQTHYLSVCRSAHVFNCLTCFQRFDRESIVPHTSCVSEQEKYTKGDSKIQEQAKRKEKMLSLANIKDNIDELDFSKLKWKGFRKTSREILSMISVKKITLDRLISELTKIYAKKREVKEDEVDQDLVKKYIIERLQNESDFQIDLGKKLIKLKN